MSTAVLADDFLDLLIHSELLPAEQVRAVARELQLHGKKGTEAAAAFIQRKLLTSFQADRLLEGRYRGFIIGRYTVLHVLGSGGMGWVYVGVDRKTGERVALKVLAERHSEDAGMVARFRLEGRAGQKFQHPGIVRIIEMGEAGSQHYIAMELVEGISVQELMDRGKPLPATQACDIAKQVAAALQASHAAGLVHRDIKPANILVDKTGGVKVLDFGLALLGEAEREEEFSLAMIFGHECLGTADYISPEQSYDSFQVDSRADIYSLGGTLYAMLTAKPPFADQPVNQRLHANRNLKPKSLDVANPAVSTELAAVVSRMMEKDRDRRYADCGELIIALTPFAQRTPAGFDFNKILELRATEARRRAAAIKQAKANTQSGNTPAQSSSRIAPSSVARLSTARLQQPLAETDIGVRLPPAAEQRNRAVPAVLRVNPMTALDAATRSGPSAAIPTGNRSEEILLAQPDVARLGFRLVPQDGLPPATSEFRMLTGRARIGRGHDCDLRIDSRRVSSRHCELLFEGGWWRIVDLDSSNGIAVNGTAVREQWLSPGDRITIAGQFTYLLAGPGPKRGVSIWTLLLVAVFIAAAAVGVWLIRPDLLGLNADGDRAPPADHLQSTGNVLTPNGTTAAPSTTESAATGSSGMTIASPAENSAAASSQP